MSWRRSQVSSRDDLIFYTITSDTTLRLFLPVLDAPEYMQLHAAIDLFSSLPYSAGKQVNSLASSVFWLDRITIEKVFVKILADRNQADDAQIRKIREIKEEGWDLFLRILADGSVVVTAVATAALRRCSNNSPSCNPNPLYFPVYLLTCIFYLIQIQIFLLLSRHHHLCPSILIHYYSLTPSQTVFV
jgi:hypothetical protein